MRNFFLRFFPGTPNILVPGDSAFMLFKCMCNNISIEKKKLFGKKNMSLSNQFAKFFKMRTCFHFTYWFDLKKAYKNMLRSQ